MRVRGSFDRRDGNRCGAKSWQGRGRWRGRETGGILEDSRQHLGGRFCGQQLCTLDVCVK